MDEIAEIADALLAEFTFEGKQPKAYVSQVSRAGLVTISFTNKMKANFFGLIDTERRELQQSQDKEAQQEKFL